MDSVIYLPRSKCHDNSRLSRERPDRNVIVATAKRATVEPKPEVRKAGGVFYTPQYIVKYIVENTVGAHLSSHPYEGGVAPASGDGVVLSSEAPPLDVLKGSAFPSDAKNDSGGIAAVDLGASDGEAELRRTSSGKAAKVENHPTAKAAPLLRKEGSRKITDADVSLFRGHSPFARIAKSHTTKARFIT